MRPKRGASSIFLSRVGHLITSCFAGASLPLDELLQFLLVTLFKYVSVS